MEAAARPLTRGELAWAHSVFRNTVRPFRKLWLMGCVLALFGALAAGGRQESVGPRLCPKPLSLRR